jgi:uncharacterized membrane protein
MIAWVIFLPIDILWIGVIAKDFYAKQIGFLIRDDINWLAAVLFYLLFIAGLISFVIKPALEKKSWTHALLYGALFGLVSYATYDLTNLAAIKNWPVLVSVIDMGCFYIVFCFNGNLFYCC